MLFQVHEIEHNGDAICAITAKTGSAGFRETYNRGILDTQSGKQLVVLLID